jgi:inosine/xanthosine triphosphate pyrophosphatase family protein
VNRLIVATTNPGKVHEMQSARVHCKLVREPLPTGLADIEEMAFIENAILKAPTSRFVDGLTVADDSGLSVTALMDGPVPSRRAMA